MSRPRHCPAARDIGNTLTMDIYTREATTRRRFLRGSLGIGICASLARPGAAARRADEPPPVPVTNPKAISGDRIEPD